MDSLEQQREHFNAVADQYRTARSNPKHLKLKELLWDFALAPIQLPDNFRVLEAMCGFADGYDILSSRYKNFEYFGFDYSDQVINSLRKQRPGLNVWHEDVTKFESDKSFDVLLLLGGLHHVSDYSETVVEKLTSVLSPGGIFINLEPTHGNPLTRLIRENIYRRNALFDEKTERAFDVDNLKSLFRSVGLEEERIIYPGLLSYVLFYNPDAFPLLNIGSTRFVSLLWALEKPFMRTLLAKTLSFATLSIWRKPHLVL